MKPFLVFLLLFVVICLASPVQNSETMSSQIHFPRFWSPVLFRISFKVQTRLVQSSPVQSSPVMVSIRAHKCWKRIDWNRFELAKMSLISVSLFRSISLSHKGQEVSVARKITRKFCCWRKFGICSTSWKTLQLISCNPLLSPTSFIALTKTERLFRLITSVKWRNNSVSPWEIIEPPRLNALLLS